MWFFVPVLLVALLPWTPLLALPPPADRRKDPRVRFLAAWSAATFLLFSLVTNKLPGYLLPMLPALAALGGLSLAGRKTVWPVLAAGAALLGLMPLAASLLPGALAEGLVLAERLGLDIESFLQVARASAAYSQVMDVKGPKMVGRDFAPEGRVTQHLKDVHLILEQAARKGQRLPLLEVHADVLEACVRRGEGDLDNCAVIEEVRRRST